MTQKIIDKLQSQLYESLNRERELEDRIAMGSEHGEMLDERDHELANSEAQLERARDLLGRLLSGAGVIINDEYWRKEAEDFLTDTGGEG